MTAALSLCPRLRQPVDLSMKGERLEDNSHNGRERLHVCVQILLDVVLPPHQLLHFERRCIVKKMARLPQQKRFRGRSGSCAVLMFGLNGKPSCFQQTIQCKWQHHFSVIGLLVVSPQRIGDSPDERRRVWIAHGIKSFRHQSAGFQSGQNSGREP